MATFSFKWYRKVCGGTNKDCVKSKDKAGVTTAWSDNSLTVVVPSVADPFFVFSADCSVRSLSTVGETTDHDLSAMATNSISAASKLLSIFVVGRFLAFKPDDLWGLGRKVVAKTGKMQGFVWIIPWGIRIS